MYGYRKYSHPTHGRITGSCKGGQGLLKARIFKGKYKLRVKFPEEQEGGGLKLKKKLHGESMEIFWNNTTLKGVNSELSVTFCTISSSGKVLTPTSLAITIKPCFVT